MTPATTPTTGGTSRARPFRRSSSLERSIVLRTSILRDSERKFPTDPGRPATRDHRLRHLSPPGSVRRWPLQMSRRTLATAGSIPHADRKPGTARSSRQRIGSSHPLSERALGLRSRDWTHRWPRDNRTRSNSQSARELPATATITRGPSRVAFARGRVEAVRASRSDDTRVQPGGDPVARVRTVSMVTFGNWSVRELEPSRSRTTSARDWLNVVAVR